MTEKRNYITKRIKGIGSCGIGFEYWNTNIKKSLDHWFNSGSLKVDDVYKECVSNPDGDLGLLIHFDFIGLEPPTFKITENDRETMLNTYLELQETGEWT